MTTTTKSKKRRSKKPTARLTATVTELSYQIDALRREMADLASAFRRWGRAYDDRVPRIDQPRRTELLTKLLAFLAGEFARKEYRQCVSIHLSISISPPSLYEEVHAWTRGEFPGLFEFVSIETLAESLLAFAEKDVVMRGRSCRYNVQTRQHLGGHQNFSFRLRSPLEDGFAS